MGLLDFDTPQSRLGLGLLAAASARADGAGFGQRLAEAVGSVDQWKQQQQRAKMQEMQMRYQQALMLEHQQKLAALNKAQEMAAQKQAALPSIFSPGSPARAAGVDVQRALMAGYTPDEIEKLDKLRNVGLDEVARTVKGMQGGREVEQQVDKFGRPVGQGFEQFRAPIEISTGARKDLLDPYSLAPRASVAMEQSPDSKASNAVAWANNALNKQRLAFDIGGGGDGSDQASLIKQFGKPEPGRRWRPDGSLEPIPGGSADTKAQLKEAGASGVASVVAGLRDKYNQLNESGGVVNEDRGAISNIGARIGASGLGQTIGGAVGTRNQNARDAIVMTRPILLQEIMKATGMSAKQMDSNAELKLYLSTATDPTKGYQANMEALDQIERRFGINRQDQTPITDKNVSLADIAETARKSGRSTAEVTAALKAKGYKIGGQ